MLRLGSDSDSGSSLCLCVSKRKKWKDAESERVVFLSRCEFCNVQMCAIIGDVLPIIILISCSTMGYIIYIPLSSQMI